MFIPTHCGCLFPMSQRPYLPPLSSPPPVSFNLRQLGFGGASIFKIDRFGCCCRLAPVYEKRRSTDESYEELSRFASTPISAAHPFGGSRCFPFRLRHDSQTHPLQYPGESRPASKGQIGGGGFG